MTFAFSRKVGQFIRHIRHNSVIDLISLIKQCVGCKNLIRHTSDTDPTQARRPKQLCRMPSDTCRMRHIDATHELIHFYQAVKADVSDVSDVSTPP